MVVWNHPCGLCGKPVRSNQAGIQCDVYQLWLHIKCLGMMKTYGYLQVSDESWGCPSHATAPVYHLLSVLGSTPPRIHRAPLAAVLVLVVL